MKPSKDKQNIQKIIAAAWKNNETAETMWKRLRVELGSTTQPLQRFWNFRLHEVLADEIRLCSKKTNMHNAFSDEEEDLLIRRAAAFLSNQGPEVCCFLGTVLHKSHWSIRQRCVQLGTSLVFGESGNVDTMETMLLSGASVASASAPPPSHEVANCEQNPQSLQAESAESVVDDDVRAVPDKVVVAIAAPATLASTAAADQHSTDWECETAHSDSEEEEDIEQIIANNEPPHVVESLKAVKPALPSPTSSSTKKNGKFYTAQEDDCIRRHLLGRGSMRISHCLDSAAKELGRNKISVQNRAYSKIIQTVPRFTAVQNRAAYVQLTPMKRPFSGTEDETESRCSNNNTEIGEILRTSLNQNLPEYNQAEKPDTLQLTPLPLPLSLLSFTNCTSATCCKEYLW